MSAVEQVLTTTLLAELPSVESTTQQIDFTENIIEETHDETEISDEAHAEHENTGEPHVEHAINGESHIEPEINGAIRAERCNTAAPVIPATEPIVQPIQACSNRTV
ncbi:hypothetical protein PR002_g1069 [Phytophthora rubi]|uniref:Uncharacterized protein n=1 Tax=Phytophthora rubi TaxID=129364 RepID=A0A6A3P197_9STRA|nr:hypothetical protein PR002_g1069 [Phytophthora rubi]